MRTAKWLLILGIAVSGLLLAAQRASMEAPVVRGTPEDVTVAARFTQFTSGSEYRLGVGGSAALPGIKLTLDKDGAELSISPSDFGQPQSWWSDAGELKATGFLLQDSLLPKQGEFLNLKVVVPRGTADSAGAFFIFVAKRYGPNTWYLEDGAEINKTHW